MNREDLPKDQSAWDWIFGGQASEGAGAGETATEGTGTEGTASSEGRGSENRRIDEPGDTAGAPGIGGSVERETAKPPVVKVPLSEAEAPYRMGAGEGIPEFQFFPEATPTEAPVRRATREVRGSAESWRRAVVTAVILGPPKAGRGRRLPW